VIPYIDSSQHRTSPWLQDKLTHPNAIVELDLDFIWRSRERTSDPWGTTQPHNAWKDLPAGWPQSRLDFCQSGSLYHESIKSAPTDLHEPFRMITLNDLKKKFSGSWEPTCPALGLYEAQCKKDWGQSVCAKLLTFFFTFETFLSSGLVN
jgi:hypothetical protein